MLLCFQAAVLNSALSCHEPFSFIISFQHMPKLNASAACDQRASRFCYCCLQWVLLKLHLMRLEKRKITILNKVSTILTPGRTTLLLGPPGGGKVCFCCPAGVASLLERSPFQKVWAV